MSPAIPFSGLPALGQGFAQGNITGDFPATTVFTAPVAGLYHFAAVVFINSTDGAGTINLNVTFPDTPTAFAAPLPVTPAAGKSTSRAFPVLLKTGDRVQISTSTSGLTATTYTYLFGMLQLAAFA